MTIFWQPQQTTMIIAVKKNSTAYWQFQLIAELLATASVTTSATAVVVEEEEEEGGGEEGNEEEMANRERGCQSKTKKNGDFEKLQKKKKKKVGNLIKTNKT